MKLISKETTTLYTVCHDDYDDRYYEVHVNSRNEIVYIINSATGDPPYNEDLVEMDFKKMLESINERTVDTSLPS